MSEPGKAAEATVHTMPEVWLPEAKREQELQPVAGVHQLVVRAHGQLGATAGIERQQQL